MKSAKIVEIMWNHGEFTLPSRFAPISSAADLALEALTPEALDKVPRSAKGATEDRNRPAKLLYMLLYVRKNKSMANIKSHEIIGMNGWAPLELAIYHGSKNSTCNPMPCDRWKPSAGTLEMCLFSHCDWSCKLRHAKVSATGKSTWKLCSVSVSSIEMLIVT